MTRKHYISIASALRALLRSDTSAAERLGIERTVAVIADNLAQDNPRFDRAKFFAAALGDSVHG